MKLIIAIIPFHKLEDVIHELDKIKIYRKTISNVLGVGQSHPDVHRDNLEAGNFVKKVRFEIAVNEDLVEPALEAITKAANNVDGDGKIFVLDLADCIQIGSGKKGPEAIGQ